MTVLCLLETDADGTAADASLRALAVARELASSGGEPLAAVWFGQAGMLRGAELTGAGVKNAYRIKAQALSQYAPQAWGRALTGLAAGLPGGGTASAIVAAATDHGNEVLAHAAAIAGLPMAANCVSAASKSPGEWALVRQRWAGSLLEDAVLQAPLALLTVAADAVPADAVPAPSSDGAQLPEREYEPQLTDADLVVRAAESAERKSGVSLASARVVVGGGRGVGGPDGFAALEELAGLLGGVVGVSRVVTSEGWRPHRQQVGQTGTKITPDLYLACGISGAIQHMAGCQGAKTIVAINTDPGAPIVTKADYAVIGDLHQIIPALVETIRARSSDRARYAPP
jgi:electron transfer flavoprotein alpha subunit